MGKTNIVMLIGNLGGDIQIRHFDGGGCIGRVSLATTEKYKKKNSDEVVQDTEWHNLVFSGKGAEIMEKYTKKGSKISVTGRIKYRVWEKDGQKNYMTEIKVRDFEFLDSKGDNNSNDKNGSKVDEYEKNQQQSQASSNEDEDDLPF